MDFQSTAFIELASDTVVNTSGTGARLGSDASISGPGALIKEGPGAVHLLAPNNYTGGTRIEDGTLWARVVGAFVNNTAYTVNGGTLDLGGFGLTMSSLSGNGGTIALGSAYLTVHQSSDTAFSGTISGSGGLIKSGIGTLSLTGNSSYAGLTQVTAGTLMIGNGAADTAASLESDVLVANSGVLGGFGSINGNVNVQSGGKLAPGKPEGTLTINGNLSLDQGSQLLFSFGAPDGYGNPGQGHDVQVNGDLAINGATINTIDAGNFGPGLYRLFSYTGALSQVNGGIILPASGYTVQILTVAKQINLITTDGMFVNFWNSNGQASATQLGGGIGTWAQPNANWADAQGVQTTTRQPINAFAVFGGEAGIVTVSNVGSSPVSAIGIQFASDGYRLVGDALVLDTTLQNSLSEVRVGDGSGASANWTATISNVLEGNGIQKTGAGTLVLEAANTYSGGTTISAGTLVANHDDGSVIDALGTGLITLNGGRLHSTLGRSTLNSYLVSAGTTGTISTATGTELWLNGGAGQSFSLQGNLIIGTNDATGDVVMDVIGTNAAPASTITVAYGRLVDGNGSLGSLTAFAGATRIASGAALDLSAQGGIIRNLQDATPGNGGTVSWVNNPLYLYGGSFSGQFVNSLGGELVKGSTDTLLLNGDNSGFSGTTTVADGKLVVGDINNSSATLGGTIDVLSGAILGGYGSLGETTVQSGGILSPGNSIGTLAVDGDLTLKPGSVLEIEIASNGASDRVDVTGTATVSRSNVSVTTIDPETSYQNGQLYNILTADGGISGEFAGVVSNSAFLDMSLAYGNTAADLKICLKTGCPSPVDPETPGPGTPEPEKPSPALFTTVAQTRNQLATAGGLDTLAQTGSSLALYNSLLMLSADEARAAFDSLSGEAYASAKGVLINDSQFIRNAALGRLQQAFGGAPATPINALSYAGTQRHGSASASAIDTVAPSRIAPAQNLYAAWGYAFGAWTRQDSNSNAGSVKSSVGGFVTGIDGAVLDTWRLGLLAGYSHSNFDVDDRASSGSSDNYTLGAYAGTEWTLNNANALAFRSGLAYTWHDVDMNRSVAFPDFADNLTGDYDAGSFQLFGELGYKVHYGKALFEPYAGLAYLRLRSDGFDEKGQTAAALSVHSGTTDTSFSTLGLRASTEFVLGSITVTAGTDLGWRHAYGDITPVSTASFIGSDAFTVSGLPIAEDAALIEAGLDFKLTEDATLGLSYNGQFASGAKQNGFNAKLSVSF
ncbi:autotransporter domain-containing protein [Ochrobactrum sp. RH2CCR150]|uniref:autotransporter domain-containing protein n=1 Tax=Ochrobactrum sp. RH2CCR150 TaxID=2587044 RepID=UPI0015FB5812|nr:outer membrane autotransporter protein [Ochrobactrum sp. RH2CCR150]